MAHLCKPTHKRERSDRTCRFDGELGLTR